MDDLALRILCEGLEDQEFVLADGMSIGSSPENTIVIDDPTVLPVHAHVIRFPDQWELRCRDGAIVLLEDGTPTTGLGIFPGMVFIVASAVFQCIQLPEPLPQHCARCGADLLGVPHAKFCPRCGIDLYPAGAESDPKATKPPSVAQAKQDTKAEPYAKDVSTQILTAYAAAIGLLGFRYETGRGGSRNDDEALRCYLKAARLGNEQARSRLLARGIELTGC